MAKSKLSYCVVCKKPTGNKDIHIETAKNNRKMQVSKCSVCSTKKIQFISNKQKGKGVVDKFVSALPVELHLIGTDEKDGKNKKMSFCGPGTKLHKRLGPNDVSHDWSKPINDLDQACYKHDIAYRNTDAKARNAADKILQNAATQFLKKPGISTLDKIDGHIVDKAMRIIKRKE